MDGSYNALIIDSDFEHRNRLKTAMRSVNLYNKVFAKLVFCTRFEDAARMMDEEDNSFDVVFLSSRNAQQSIKEFVGMAKQKVATRDAAFVLMKDCPGKTASFISGVLEGIDSFLVAPYSVAQLIEITVLAERIRRERREARFSVALKVLVKGIESQLGQLAQLKKRNYNATISERVFKEMCAAIKELDEQKLDEYFEVLVDTFTKIESPSEGCVSLGAGTYGGASQRIRSRASNKTLARFKDALAA